MPDGSKSVVNQPSNSDLIANAAQTLAGQVQNLRKEIDFLYGKKADEKPNPGLLNGMPFNEVILETPNILSNITGDVIECIASVIHLNNRE